MTKSSTHRLRSTLDALRTQARKLNVEFNDAMAGKVRDFLAAHGPNVPRLEIDKRGTVYLKTEYGKVEVK